MIDLLVNTTATIVSYTTVGFLIVILHIGIAIIYVPVKIGQFFRR